MTWSRRDLREIERRARTLDERLESARDRGVPTAAPALDDRRVATRLERWRTGLAPEGDSAFARRLRLQGVDPGHLPEVLGDDAGGATEPLPPWAEILRDGVRASAEPVGEADRAAFDPDAPLPFEDLFEPLLRVARQRLAARPGPRIAITEAARGAFERGLLCWLSFVAAPTLELEFSCFRAARRTGVARLASPSNEPSTAEYAAFSTSWRHGGMATFSSEYAALARLLGSLIEQWVETTGELFDRLADDAPAIRSRFEISTELGPIVAVDGSIADRHQGGRSVYVLTFGCGLTVVYKPRSLAVDRAWFDLLGWCRTHGFPESFRGLRVIERPSHGWVEYAPSEAPEGSAASRKFFYRVGSQLALLHVLQATDLHFENVVACGDQPVLIDVETLFHPRLPDELSAADARTAQDLAEATITTSVLRTGWLPRWQLGADGRGVDLTGLGAAEQAQETAVPGRRWSDLNTDAMRLHWAGARVEPSTAASHLAERVDPDAVDALVAGFRRMARFLEEHRPALVAEDGPLASFGAVRTRVLLRPTQVYASLRARALAPDHLRHGVDRSLELEALGRAFDHDSLQTAAGPLLAAEKRALERLDIPLAESTPTATSVRLDDRSGSVVVFDRSGFARALDALRAFDTDAVERQVAIIRGAFAARLAATDDARRPRPSTAVGAPQSRVDPWLDAATAIARQLVEQAIVAPDGGTTWIAPRYLDTARCHQLEPLGPGLYDGLAGIALFLAEAAAETGDAAFEATSRGAVLSLQQQWRACRTAPMDLGLGGASGIGGLLYAAARLDSRLADTGLTELAMQDIAAWDVERWADEPDDVLSGAAGALLGLLAVHRQLGSSDALERALEGGHHLLDRRLTEASERAWTSLHGSPLSGFSHGAAGIAYALVQLAGASGETAFADAAREAIGWERSLHDPQTGRWPDRRRRSRHDRTIVAGSWCHGAAGIGLARLGGLDVLDEPAIRDEIDLAVTAVRRHGPGRVDQLCCGLAGRVELLLVAGRRLDRPELVEAARHALRPAVDVDPADLGTSPPGCFQPGLYQGLAGIGYQLLRLRAPERLPSILLWR